MAMDMSKMDVQTCCPLDQPKPQEASQICYAKGCHIAHAQNSKQISAVVLCTNSALVRFVPQIRNLWTIR